MVRSEGNESEGKIKGWKSWELELREYYASVDVNSGRNASNEVRGRVGIVTLQ